MEEKQELAQPSLHRIDEAKLAVCLKTPSEESHTRISCMVVSGDP